jgi:outer membrane receptor protein involved in Fe transport
MECFKKRRDWLFATALTSALTSFAAPALAQQATDPDDDAEIVVTARKAEERLQDVPLSITALSARDIEESGVDSVADVAALTPGFSFRQGFGRSGGGQGGAAVRPAIRGMSNILGAPNSAFFVDGVFVSGNITSYQLDNLERVEVIRGPQSALFGRQTFSGAINFITRAPGDEVAGRATATFAEHDHAEFNGYVAGPVFGSSVLKGELNARYYRFGGDYKNADTGDKDIGAQRSVNFGGKLIYQPTDNFTATLTGGWSEDRDKSFAYAFNGSNRLNCFLPNIIGAVAGIPRSSTQSRGYFCGEIRAPSTWAWNDPELEDLGFEGVERTAWRAALTLNYEFDNGFTITSITAKNDSQNVSSFDGTLLPSTNPSFTIGGSRTDDVSTELRIATPRDARIRALAGLYYYKEEDGRAFTFNQTTRQRTYSQSDNAVTNQAVFGMVEVDVTDRLTVTGEIRQQSEEIEAGGLFSPTTPRPGPRSATFDATLPRLTARLRVTDDLNLYAVAARGNKPGGFNDFPTDMLFADQEDFVRRGFSEYEEEKADSYEIGAKGQIGGVNFAVAAYYIDWLKQQLSRSEPYELFLTSNPSRTVQRTPRAFATTPFIVNAGESEIKGGEIELFGRLTSVFDYRLGYSYSDARFLDFYDENTEEIYDTDGRPRTDPLDRDGPTGQVKGKRLPQTPEHMANASGTLRLPINDGLDWFVRGDYSYESKRYVQVDNLAWIGDSHNLNLRTGFETGRYTITAFYNNVLDDETPAVVTRLLDFNRTLLIPDPVRRFAGQPVRLTFYRDFTISGARKPQAGVTFSAKF